MILKAEIKLDATGSRELSGTGVEPKTGFIRHQHRSQTCI